MLLPLLQNNVLSVAGASATIGGLTSLTEAQVVAGEQTTITLLNDTWVGATFDAQRQNIINGDTSDQSELLGWNTIVRDNEPVTSVVRTSDTVVTISWSAAPTYDITSDETRTITIPASALTGGVGIVAIPTVGITADVEDVTEEIRSGGWAALNAFDSFRQRKRRRERELEDILEEVEELSGVDGEIAVLIHKNDVEELLEQSIRELERLVVDNFSERELKLAKAHNERVAIAFARAATQRNFSALQAFEREMERARDEEDFFLLAVMTLQ